MMSLSSQDIMVGLMVTQANMVGQRKLKTTYNNTTSPLLNIYTINLSRSRYSELACHSSWTGDESLTFSSFNYCLYCLCLRDC